MDLARTGSYSTDQDLLTALNRFGLDKIIRNHLRGLDMPLGEDGLGLSGGQKQIIALARMTLRNPKVVLLASRPPVWTKPLSVWRSMLLPNGAATAPCF